MLFFPIIQNQPPKFSAPTAFLPHRCRAHDRKIVAIA